MRRGARSISRSTSARSASSSASCRRWPTRTRTSRSIAICLIELYDRYGTPLAARAQVGDESVRPELARLGEHGLRPLLDVLVDGEAHELRVAVALLGAIGNPSAAPALFKLRAQRTRCASTTTMRGPARFELRELGALAAAEVATGKELPLLQKMLAEPEKQLRVAAAYGYGRLGRQARAGGNSWARSMTAPSTCRRWPVWRSAPTPTAAPSTP